MVNNVLSAWSRVLLEKVAGFYLVKKFPAFYGTRRFIAAFTSSRYPIPSHFVTRYILTFDIAQLPSWSTTFCRLSATDSIYSRLPSIMEAVPPSATRGERDRRDPLIAVTAIRLQNVSLWFDTPSGSRLPLC
jgi:hypothetical protein